MQAWAKRLDDDRWRAALALALLFAAVAASRLAPDLATSSGLVGAVLNALLGGGSIAVLFLLLRGAVLHHFLFDGRWRRQLLLGGLIGALALAAYLAAAAWAGAIEIPPTSPSKGWLRAPLILAEALFVAAALQFAVSGLLLEILKRGFGSALALPVAAAGFALLDQWGSSIDAERLVGVALVLGLLAALRLLQGSIYFGVGLLCGAMTLERLRGILWNPLGPVSNDSPVQLFMGHDLVKSAPLFWAVAGCALVAVLGLLALRGEALPPQESKSIPTALKRVYPLAQPSLFAPLDLWLARLRQARWRIGWKYLPKLLFALPISALNTILSLPERLLLPRLLRRRPVQDPLFILGVHRSGTTHLHNLLALDPQWVTPRLYQVLNPFGFPFSGWLLLPLLLWIPPRRPMDNMPLGLLAPAEEEYALLNSSAMSPYWGFVFPQQAEYYDRFIYAEDWNETEQERWLHLYLGFLQRLTLLSPRRPLLKSPYNTGRISLLRQRFPAARFIHIRRHPYAVYRSNKRLAEHGIAVHQLQDALPGSSYLERFPTHYQRLERSWAQEKQRLGAQQAAEIRYEDLERDPLGEIERVYEQLGLEFSTAFRARLQTHLASLGSYQKNRFDEPPAGELERIADQLAPLFAEGGYERTPPV